MNKVSRNFDLLFAFDRRGRRYLTMVEGTIRYCRYAVEEDMRAGGRAGPEWIRRTESASDALDRLKRLASFGILTYEYSPDTKLLSYKVREPYRIKNDKRGLPVQCENTYGFVRVPRNVPDRLAAQGCCFPFIFLFFQSIRSIVKRF